MSHGLSGSFVNNFTIDHDLSGPNLSHLAWRASLAVGVSPVARTGLLDALSLRELRWATERAGPWPEPFVPGLIDRAQALDPEHVVLMKVDVYDAAFPRLQNAGLPVRRPAVAVPHERPPA
jgi:hypothetical protein